MNKRLSRRLDKLEAKAELIQAESKAKKAKLLRLEQLEKENSKIAHYFETRSLFEKIYYSVYDFLIQPKVEKTIYDFKHFVNYLNCICSTVGNQL